VVILEYECIIDSTSVIPRPSKIISCHLVLLRSPSAQQRQRSIQYSLQILPKIKHKRRRLGIRDRLPPGFNYAFKIVKWVVDPGLDGDVYADQPYLYGPAASSVNTLHVAGKGTVSGEAEHDAGLVFTEGGDYEGMKMRGEKGVPETEAARKKHFLNVDNRKEWEWEEGKVYGCDFFNPYLDFNSMSSLRSLEFVLTFGRRFCIKATRLYASNYEILGRPGTSVSGTP
jgi:hypothetical protein